MHTQLLANALLSLSLSERRDEAGQLISSFEALKASFAADQQDDFCKWFEVTLNNDLLADGLSLSDVASARGSGLDEIRALLAALTRQLPEAQVRFNNLLLRKRKREGAQGGYAVLTCSKTSF